MVQNAQKNGKNKNSPIITQKIQKTYVLNCEK